MPRGREDSQIADIQKMGTRWLENLTEKERPLEMLREKATGKKKVDRRIARPHAPHWSPRRRKPKKWHQ